MKLRITFHFHLITLFILIFTFTFILASCNPSEPEDNKQLTLTVEDASSTEVWVGLKTNSFSLPVSGMIKINSLAKKAVTISSSDTVIYIDSLSPNTAYKLQAELSGISSSEVTVTTMDTTSHNFTWQTYTFGGANGSSVLNDVAIINENDIWAVGEIHTTETDQFDGNGVWVQPYNAVHWDGSNWELKRIYVNYRGNPNFAPLKGAFALPDGKIIFSSGLPYLPEGDHWKLYHLWDMGVLNNNDGSVYSIWGTSISNLYFAGNKGTIVHYNGSPSADGWTKIESGTELKFHDIYGKNEKIYCVAAQLFSGINSELYEIKNNNALLIDNTNLGLSSVSVYVLREKLYVFGYYRLVRTEGKIGWEQISEPVNFDGYTKIRGNGYNDIVAVGSFGKIYHYNGISWKLRRIGEDINNLIDFSSVAIKNNIICAVGKTKNFATIVIGRR